MIGNLDIMRENNFFFQSHHENHNFVAMSMLGVSDNLTTYRCITTRVLAVAVRPWLLTMGS